MPGQSLAAILADAFISGVNVIATKTNLSFRDSVITNQQDDPGNADHAIHQPMDSSRAETERSLQLSKSKV